MFPCPRCGNDADYLTDDLFTSGFQGPTTHREPAVRPYAGGCCEASLGRR